jgi:hypothetical protein
VLTRSVEAPGDACIGLSRRHRAGDHGAVAIVPASTAGLQADDPNIDAHSPHERVAGDDWTRSVRALWWISHR